jgi:hypothetical protein
LIAEGKARTEDEIRELMGGNICRCGAYPNIVVAIQQAMGCGARSARSPRFRALALFGRLPSRAGRTQSCRHPKTCTVAEIGRFGIAKREPPSATSADRGSAVQT